MSMESWVKFHKPQNISGTSAKAAAQAWWQVEVVNNANLNHFGILGLLETWMTGTFFLVFFHDLRETSPRLLQLIRRMFQRCFVWRLQNCFVDCRAGGFWMSRKRITFLFWVNCSFSSAMKLCALLNSEILKMGGFCRALQLCVQLL